MTEQGENTGKTSTCLWEDDSSFASVNQKENNCFPCPFVEKKFLCPFGRGFEYLSKNIYYCYAYLERGSRYPAKISGKDDFIQMNFCLKGKNSCYLQKGGDLIFHMSDQSHNIFYVGNKGLKIIAESHQKLEVIVIAIQLSYFLKYLIPQVAAMEMFQQSLQKGEVCKLSEVNLQMNPRILTALQELIKGKHKAAFRSNLVEARIIELLTLQFQAVDDLFAVKKEAALKEEDIEKMENAKEILVSKMVNPPKLKELAHQVGTNEYNLKKHFKIVFGTTVFGYLHEYKMEKAKSLLLNKEFQIASIATELGFKHATHFTAAFKKHFGFLPKQYRGKN